MSGAWRMEDLKCALPKPPSPPLSDDGFFLIVREIGKNFVFAFDNGADWDLNDEILTERPAERCPEPFLPFSAVSSGVKTKIEESTCVFIGTKMIGATLLRRRRRRLHPSGCKSHDEKIRRNRRRLYRLEFDFGCIYEHRFNEYS